MKNNFHKQKQIINYISSSEKFKVLFYISILIAAYASFILGISANNYEIHKYVGYSVSNLFL